MIGDAAITVTVTALPDQLEKFIGLCKTIQYLGSAGCSRTVEISIDGDGAARLRFDFGETDTANVSAAPVGDGDTVVVPGID